MPENKFRKRARSMQFSCASKGHVYFHSEIFLNVEKPNIKNVLFFCKESWFPGNATVKGTDTCNGRIVVYKYSRQPGTMDTCKL